MNRTWRSFTICSCLSFFLPPYSGYFIFTNRVWIRAWVKDWVCLSVCPLQAICFWTASQVASLCFFPTALCALHNRQPCNHNWSHSIYTNLGSGDIDYMGIFYFRGKRTKDPDLQRCWRKWIWTTIKKMIQASDKVSKSQIPMIFGSILCLTKDQLLVQFSKKGKFKGNYWPWCQYNFIH